MLVNLRLLQSWYLKKEKQLSEEVISNEMTTKGEDLEEEDEAEKGSPICNDF